MSAEKTYTEREVVLRERDAINEAVEWVFREARAAKKSGDGGIEGVDARDLAIRLRPLPTVTRPRVVTDPHNANLNWSYENAALLVGCNFYGGRQRYPRNQDAPLATEGIMPTPERISLWADLLDNPTEEVEA